VVQRFRELASLARHANRDTCAARTLPGSGATPAASCLSNRVANSSAITRVVIDASVKVFCSESST